MLAAELYAPHRFRLIEIPSPAPAAGEVQVRVEACGICGSDLHNFSEGSIGDLPCVYPMVLGHEPAGTVAAVGAGVSGWAVGDRVALEPAVYCYHCEYCLAGRHNVCANIRFLSMPADPGFFRELVNLPASNLLPLPKEISFAEGSLFEPLAVALHSMKFAQLRPGERVVIFGAGPIGLLTLFCARLSGATRVFVVEPVEARRALALRLGADAAFDPAGASELRHMDAAIDCATRGTSLDQAIQLTRNAGRLVVTGIPSASRLPVDFHTLRRKEITLFNVRRSNHESELALELLREHRTRLAPILTHQMPIERIEEAFTTLEQHADGVGKIVVKVAK